MTTSTGRRATTVAAVVALALSAAACGDDDESNAISSVEDWCGVVKVVDTRFDETDNSSESFAVKQAHYREINGLLRSLRDSIDVVDAEVRDAVKENVDWALSFTDVLIAAESEQSASDELFGENGVFAKQELLGQEGPAWILYTCDVNINGED